jgi:hypothetical protein
MASRRRAAQAAAMQKLVLVALLASGLVHLVPTLGVLGPSQLQRLYGVAVAAPELVLLMRHRALLFGLIGALQLAALASPGLRLAALLVGLVSALGYVALAWPPSSVGPALARVAWIDLGLVLLLAPALALEVLARR